MMSIEEEVKGPVPLVHLHFVVEVVHHPSDIFALFARPVLHPFPHLYNMAASGSKTTLDIPLHVQYVQNLDKVS